MQSKNQTSARWWRWLVGAVVGAIVGTIVCGYLGLPAGLLSGWAAGAASVVVWVLLVTWRMTGEQTRTHARLEDPGRRIAGIVATIGALASLGAVGVALVTAKQSDGGRQLWIAAIVVLAVVASWFLVQVDSMLRFARMYYADPEGGIDFNQAEPPAYSDFAYISFGLGLTYQVADTNIQTTQLRRVIVAQSLLGYLFGAVILATIINLISSLA